MKKNLIAELERAVLLTVQEGVKFDFAPADALGLTFEEFSVVNQIACLVAKLKSGEVRGVRAYHASRDDD